MSGSHGCATEVLNAVRLLKSFWHTRTELRGAAVGRWLLALGLVPWLKGAPPRLEFVRLTSSNGTQRRLVALGFWRSCRQKSFVDKLAA